MTKWTVLRANRLEVDLFAPFSWRAAQQRWQCDCGSGSLCRHAKLARGAFHWLDR